MLPVWTYRCSLMRGDRSHGRVARAGVGLLTPRGSGTNGYVQRNLSSLRPSSFQKKPMEDFSAMAAPAPRKPNKEILEHEAKRKVELQLVEMVKKLQEVGK